MLRVSLLLFAVACSGSKAPAPQPESAPVAEPSRAVQTAEPSEAPSVDDCAALAAAVTAAADAGAVCEQDSDCAVREIGACAIDGLDCYSVHYNPALPTEPLDEALAAHATGCLRKAACRCAEPAGTACIEGRCQRPRG